MKSINDNEFKLPIKRPFVCVGFRRSEERGSEEERANLQSHTVSVKPPEETFSNPPDKVQKAQEAQKVVRIPRPLNRLFLTKESH